MVVVAVAATWTAHEARADPTADSRPKSQRIDSVIPVPAVLEERNAKIGEILIEADNIFDLDNPLEDKMPYRWANTLHIVTKPTTIRSQLLFEEGDIYSERLTEESERILRQNRYLGDVKIEPVNYEDGIVDLRVRTTDVWTLRPRIGAARAGGENRLGFGLKEQNLLGNGVSLGFKYKSTVDRETAIFNYTDRNFRGSRYQLHAVIGENSDGFNRSLSYAKPFYSMDSRRAGGFSFASEERIDPLYERGEIMSEFNHKVEQRDVSLGRSAGLKGDWSRRYSVGVVYDDHQFAQSTNTASLDLVPDDRKFVYPYVGFQLVEDRFEEAVNLDQIGRVEDRFLGMGLLFRLGYSSTSAGSTSNAWHFRAGLSDALIASEKNSLTVGADLAGRYGDGAAQNVLLEGGTRFHHRWNEKHLFYASLTGTVGENLDLDNQLLLGGDTGLRGYPLRYQGGDAKMLLTLEHRIFTDWFPVRLFNVGGAVFFDAGRTWGANPVGGENLGLLRNVGFGLRLGNKRSGQGRVLHVDLAFPLDGDDSIDSVQLLFQTKSSF